MAIKYGNIIEICMTSLKLVAQHPFSNPTIANVVASFNMVTGFIYIVLVIKLIPDVYHDVDLLILCMETFTFSVMIFVKSFALMVNRKELTQLYVVFLNFWNADEYPEALRKAFERRFEIGYKVATLFYVLCITTTLLLYVFLILNPHELWFLCYVPNFPHAHIVLQMLQFFNPPLFSATTCGYDLLFMVYWLHLATQMRLVAYRFEHIAPNDRGEFRTCIEHHKLLMHFAHTMVDLWSGPLLVEYGIMIGMSCAELYKLQLGEQNPFVVIRMMCIVCGLLIQCGVCAVAPATFIEEADQMVDALFGSSWYEADHAWQMDVLFAVQCTQQEIEVRAAGMLEVNRASYLRAVRATISFLAIIKQMKQ